MDGPDRIGVVVGEAHYEIQQTLVLVILEELNGVQVAATTTAVHPHCRSNPSCESRART